MNYIENPFTEQAETEMMIEDVINKSFNMVCNTMGPNAKLILIIERNTPVVTRDGVRVAKALDFGDIRKNSIAKLITSAAIKTDEMVGDGTTTTVFMVKNLYDKFKGSLDFITVNIINELVKKTKVYLAEEVMEVNPHDERFVRMVYTTSNYQADIADTIINLFRQYRTPKVTLKKGAGQLNDIIDVHTNITFDGSYASPHLQPNSPRNALVLEQSHVLLLDNMVTALKALDIKLIIDNVVKHKKPLVIVARNFEPDVLNTLITINTHINKSLGIPNNEQHLFIIPFSLHVGGTSGGNVFKDLGRLFDVPVFNDLAGENIIEHTFDNVINNVNLSFSAITFDKNDSTVMKRSEGILNELEPVFEGMTITERANIIGKLLQSRIGRLRAENVTITVSGLTDAEISERYYLFEDAYRAAETSMQFGVIPGIGYGFNQAIEKLHRDVINALQEKVENDTLTPKESHYYDVAEKYCSVLASQYNYLTGFDYIVGGENQYLDLARGESSTVPEFVFDNGCAAICAIEAAWSVVKGLGRTGGVLGKSNHTYGI